VGTIHPQASQLTLSLEPGISARHISLRACVAAGVYSRGLDRVAVKLDESPSKLSEKLSGGTGDRRRDVGLELFEDYLTKTGDYTPIFYLIDKFLSDPEAQKQHALATLAEFAQGLPAMLAAAGLGTTKARR